MGLCPSCIQAGWLISSVCMIGVCKRLRWSRDDEAALEPRKAESLGIARGRTRH